MKTRKCLVGFFMLSAVLTRAQGIPSLTAAQWKQDLGFFANEITTYHRDPYHLIPKARFDAEVADLRSRIPSMKDYEIVVGLQRLAASIGDGHTFVDTGMLYGAVPTAVPIEVFWFGDELRVVRAAPEYSRVLGTRIVAVGSTPINEVRRRLQQLIPQGESEWFAMDKSARLITQIDPLAALGIIPYSNTASFTFATDSGRRFTLALHADPPGKSGAMVMLGDRVPLPFQHSDDGLWFTYLPDSQTVYVDFRSYQNLERKTKPLWDFIAQHSSKRLIVDMRWNIGGNYMQGREYLVSKIIFLPRLNRAGRLYVITGRRTFSAAMTNVTDFRRETEAILVGEPTGARPNGYQENHWFTLPNSHIRASCAMLKYRFQPFRDSKGVFPDQRVDPDWKAFRTGGDAAIDWILRQPLPDDEPRQAAP